MRVMLLLCICVPRCGIGVCNAMLLLCICVLLLCICVLHCGVDACNVTAVHMCATLRRWCV